MIALNACEAMPSSPVLVRNNVHVYGEGEEVLVFAHGFGTDQSAWAYHIERFSQSHRVVAFDHVGAGGSDINHFHPRRYSSLYSYAQDLLAILRELRLKRVTLVGHSVSGTIGILASLMDPSLFSRLILVGSSPRFLDDPESGYRGGFTRSDLNGLYSAMAGNYQAWAAGFAPLMMGYPEAPELGRQFATTLESIRPDIAHAVLRVILESDHRQDLPKVSVPVFVLQSNGDPAVPVEVGQYVSDHIPGAQLRVLNASGHLPHISRPAVVAEVIEEALRRHTTLRN